MSKLRERGYLTEEVAVETYDEEPGGKEKSYGRSTKVFFRQFITDIVKAIPSNFVEKGQKAKVAIRSSWADISGESSSFTWSIMVNRPFWSSGINVSVSMSSPKRSSITYQLNEDDSPDDIISELVLWMMRKSEGK